MSTTENPVEPGTLAIEQLADIVAGTAAFQESVRQYDPEGVGEHIHKGYYRPPDQEIASPYAVIYEAPGARWDRKSDSTVWPVGELFLDLGLLMASEDNPEGEERRFNNWHGQIAAAISQYNGPGFRMLTNCVEPPAHSDPTQGETSKVWRVGYLVSWGTH